MGNLRPRKAMEVPLHTQVSFQTQIVGTSYNRVPPSLIYFIFILLSFLHSNKRTSFGLASKYPIRYSHDRISNSVSVSVSLFEFQSEVRL